MGKAVLPPGFRFHPTDVELVLYYLKRKVMGRKLHFEAIAEVNIYKFSPWDLADLSCLKSKDLEWFFFCPIEKKYASGARVQRATENGYWKTTGKGRSVCHNGETVGIVKTLIFHLGHSPHGTRTDWVLHEYRIVDKEVFGSGFQEMFVLCKVFKKSGHGPKNGAQYGAPFNESEWSDDHSDSVANNVTSLETDVQKSLLLPEIHNSNVTSLFDHGSIADLPSVDHGASSSLAEPSGLSSNNTPVDENVGEIAHILSQFIEDANVCFDDGAFNTDVPVERENFHPSSDGFEMYDDLGDLWMCPQRNDSHLDFAETYCYTYGDALNMSFPDEVGFIELDDLRGPMSIPMEVTEPNVPSADELLRCGNTSGFQQFNGHPFSSSQLHLSEVLPEKEDQSLPASDTV